ncbi:PspC domain-containing protein [Microbacterium horticulturae]|uniref:PspC domain-containing protein n=1 Tax=Microbacterium horticulturae TaxID=3028316 RepID=A0ABY8C0U8_9MICO|nr:PspC domain-containing protein [Microbacterium sp. KACC 23027]WEG09362.1 PspC domain-containing protein [Microbacterium sp. KACC 23027]
MNALVRPLRGRMIAGVCAGLALRFGISPLAMRIIAVVLVAVFGLSLWAYVLLWIVMPNER